jgi:antirestriction protein ArdC
MKNSTFDLYEIVTEKILADIEKNEKLTWVKPWKCNNGGCFPMNGKSKKPYNGINFFLLQLYGFASPYWLTYKQVTEMGGNVKKGEKGAMVVFWKLNEYTKTNEATQQDEVKKVPILRYYNVFNVEQCENITIGSNIEKVEYNEHEKIDLCEGIVSNYISTYDSLTSSVMESDRAFYQPSKDYVQMPLLKQFASAEAFYSVYFHELGHSTGHQSRLNRKEVVATANFGSCDYGTEELVAELTSAFICAELGISNETQERNSVAYLKNWKNAIKGDKKLFIMASQRASKAAKLILNKQEEEIINEQE